MIKKFIVGFLSVVFIIISVEFALLLGLTSTVLDRDFYDEDFTDFTYQILIDKISNNFVNSDFTGYLNVEEREQILQNIFTKEDFRSNLNKELDKLQNIEVSQNGKTEIAISLAWIKEKNVLIASEMAELVYKKLPICSKNAENNNHFNCLPRNLLKEEFKTKLAISLDREVFSELPNNLTYTVQLPKDTQGTLADFVQKTLNLVFIIFSLLLLLLLFLIGLITFSTWLNILKTEFKTIFFATLSLNLVLLIIFYLPNLFIQQEGINQEEYVMLLDFFNLFFGTIAGNLLKYSLPFLIISLICWITAIILYKKRDIQLK